MIQHTNDVGEFLRRVALVVLVVALALLAWKAASVLLLIFFGVLIAVLLTAATEGLRRLVRIPWRLALGVVGILVLAFFAGIGLLVGPQLSRQASGLDENLSSSIQSFESRLAGSEWGRAVLQRVPVLEDPSGAGGAGPQQGQEGQGTQQDAQQTQPQDRGQARGQDPQQNQGQQQPQGRGGQAQGGAGSVFSTVASLLASVAKALGDLILVLFIGIFLAANPTMYQEGIAKLFPRDRTERVREVLRKLGGAIRAWLVVQLISMTVVGVVVFVGLTLIGVQPALVLALLAFLLEFIPFLGPWLAFIPAALIALSMGGTTVLWVALLYFLANILEGDILLPILEQRMIQVPPALTLGAIFLFGALFGFTGILVAAPLTAVLYVFVRTVYVQGALHRQLGNDG